MTPETPTEDVRISHRAMKGQNLDDLYLIPGCMVDQAEFRVSATKKFIRLNPTALQRPAYKFADNWERLDGDPCEEEPGMIYAMGHVVDILPEGAN